GQEADHQSEAVVAADPAVNAHLDPAALQRQFMASDPNGYLRRALEAGRRAGGLAQTKAESYRAAEMLGRLECSAGHHLAELQQARTLVALEPRSETSLQALRQAAACNGLR